MSSEAKLHFNVITIFPQMFEALRFGVIGQALQKNILVLDCVNPRQFTADFHKTVDDRPYGGGDGMVMLFEPLRQSVEHLKAAGKCGRVIYMSPHGKPLTSQRARELAHSDTNLTIVCGRYGGIDQRFIEEFVDEEISIGDYIVSGGELPAMVLIDSIGRHVPQVLGHQDSATVESFTGGLLEAPLFTRPMQVDENMVVPQILTGGHHALIQKLRDDLGRVLTQLKRPDLLDEKQLKEVAPSAKRLLQLSDPELKACGLKRDQLESFLHE